MDQNKNWSAGRSSPCRRRERFTVLAVSKWVGELATSSTNFNWASPPRTTPGSFPSATRTRFAARIWRSGAKLGSRAFPAVTSKSRPIWPSRSSRRATTSRASTPRSTTTFSRGVCLVWVVDPEDRSVTVYRPDKQYAIHNESGVLSGEDVLPGFSCRVADLLP